MYRLNADLSEKSDDDDSDSVASGGMTSRREKPLPTSRKRLQLRQNRPRSPLPYTRGRFPMSAAQSNKASQQHINPNLLPPITSSPGRFANYNSLIVDT